MGSTNRGDRCAHGFSRGLVRERRACEGDREPRRPALGHEEVSSRFAARLVHHARVEDSLSRIKDLGYRILEAIETGNYDAWGQMLDEHWFGPTITPPIAP